LPCCPAKRRRPDQSRGHPSLPVATEAAIAELRATLEQQGALLEQQSRMLEAQARQIDVLRQRLETMAPTTVSRTLPATATAVGAQAPTAAPPPSAGVQDPQRIPEMPAAVVSAGDFPRSIGIPGTEAAFRIGGQARTTLVNTFGPLGTDDRFVTSSIPAEGEQVPGEDKRTNYSASPSRLNLDLRSQSPVGPVRTFMEADFAGSGNTVRLRHAFIQARRWIAGQTWSTFSDPEAEPIGIDFEGLNAISLFRQPQVRYTYPLRPRLDLAVSLENPSPDLTGAQGVNRTPDAIVRVRFSPERDVIPRLLSRTEHVQAAILVRQLRGELIDQPETTLSTGGVGGNVSGVLVPRWDADDRFKFASNFGWGIGRYITDLGTLGGQDAVYDPLRNQLRALVVSSGYLGYERLWRPTFTSAVTYGIVNVDNLDIQA
jgi:hypothetical protein